VVAGSLFDKVASLDASLKAGNAVAKLALILDIFDIILDVSWVASSIFDEVASLEASLKAGNAVAKFDLKLLTRGVRGLPYEISLKIPCVEKLGRQHNIHFTGLTHPSSMNALPLSH